MFQRLGFSAVAFLGALSACSGRVITDPFGTPIAVIVAVPVSGVAPVEVSFDGSRSFSEGGIGQIDYYLWDFGDGSGKDSTSGAVVAHVYSTAESYRACLIVGNGSGEKSAPDCRSIAVS